MSDQLLYKRTRPDGRVECINVWQTGWQELVVADQERFDALKKKVEQQGHIPVVLSYALK